MIRDNVSYPFTTLNAMMSPISKQLPKEYIQRLNAVKNGLLYYGDYIDAFDEGDDWSEGAKFFTLSQYWSVFNNPGNCGREWLRFRPGYIGDSGEVKYDYQKDLFQDILVGNKTAPWPLKNEEIVYDDYGNKYKRPGIIYPTFRWRRFWSDMIFKIEDDETIPETWDNSIKYLCNVWTRKGFVKPDKILVVHHHACLRNNIVDAHSYEEVQKITKIENSKLYLRSTKEIAEFSC
eukprot:g1233.t1